MIPVPTKLEVKEKIDNENFYYTFKSLYNIYIYISYQLLAPRANPIGQRRSDKFVVSEGRFPKSSPL